ncbi:RNA ligase [uncultured Bifidobacterium sp.]|uniref:RNA ligase n=1 Tax=uncultured Bifidobacterium sp. TaxID=165187 RepID=UPI0027DD94B0|nr:RNA ligase [uncultured Bifidobacterium sp.]
MVTLTILRGLPASGKSTWARTRADEHTVIASADGIRRMLAGGLTDWHTRMGRLDDAERSRMERLAVESAHDIARTALRMGLDVIADMQNMGNRSLEAWRTVARDAGADVRVETMPDLPLDVLLERNRLRGDAMVDEAYLRRAYARTHPDDPASNVDGNLLDGMRANPNVRVRSVKGETDVYACNFTRDAFRNHKWDEYSSKARGLFLDHEGHVVMRGFEKFFNLGENDTVTLDKVLDHDAYPVRVERKENGFLGLIGAAPDGRLRCWSKSGLTDYSPLIERLLHETVADRADDLWRILNDRNVTMAVEVVDMQSDRHIVGYDHSRLFLLHCIRNTETFAIDPDAERLIAESFQFDRPEVLRECHDRDELKKAIESARASEREGVVLYYADGWMVKIKSDHYLRVKSLRPVLKRVLLNGKPVPMDDSERSRLVRTVLERADPDKLTYRRAEFDEPDVDMTYVGTLID